MMSSLLHRPHTRVFDAGPSAHDQLPVEGMEVADNRWVDWSLVLELPVDPEQADNVDPRFRKIKGRQCAAWELVCTDRLLQGEDLVHLVQARPRGQPWKSAGFLHDRLIIAAEEGVHLGEVFFVDVDRADVVDVHTRGQAQHRGEKFLDEREGERVVEQSHVRVVGAHERDHVQTVRASVQETSMLRR